MKKKLLAMLLAGCMIFSVTACGEKEDDTKQEAEVALGSSTLLTLGEYKGLTYNPMQVEVTDEEVDSEIQYRLMMSAEKENQEVVTETSIVNIDYEGKKDGVAFEGGTAQGQQLDIANSNYIAGFAESIVGMKVGETKDCPMTFPEDYHEEDLAGAEVVFTITVNECWTEKEAELNDAFAVKQGYENLEALYKGVRESLEQQKQVQVDNDIAVQLVKKVVEGSTFDINEEEVDAYVERDMAEQEQFAQMYGLDMETYASIYGMTLEEMTESCRENARYNIKVPLVQFEIARREGLEVTDETYDIIAKQIMQSYGFTDLEDFEASYEKTFIEKMVLSQMAMNLIVENAAADESIPAASEE